MNFKDYLYEKDSELLLEMANILHERHSEMPCNIFISAKNDSKHGPRIKIQNNYSPKLQSNNMFSMSISDLKITGNTGELKERDIKYYRDFIERNKKVLMDYWNNVKQIEDVLEELIY